MALPNSDQEVVRAVYDKFRALVDNLNATTVKEMGLTRKVSFSVGSATAPDDMERNGDSWTAQLFDKADLATKIAKIDGKGRLQIFDLAKKGEWIALRNEKAAEDKAEAAKGVRPS